MKPKIIHRIFDELFGSKVNHALIPDVNGHRVEMMEFDDSGRVLVSVDDGEPVTLSADQWQEYVEKVTK